MASPECRTLVTRQDGRLHVTQVPYKDGPQPLPGSCATAIYRAATGPDTSPVASVLRTLLSRHLCRHLGYKLAVLTINLYFFIIVSILTRECAFFEYALAKAIVFYIYIPSYRYVFLYENLKSRCPIVENPNLRLCIYVSINPRCCHHRLSPLR